MQIAEAIVLHQGKTEQEALDMALEMLKLVRIPEPEKQLTPISSSIVWWNAAARDDCHGAKLPSIFTDRRRNQRPH